MSGLLIMRAGVIRMGFGISPTADFELQQLVELFTLYSFFVGTYNQCIWRSATTRVPASWLQMWK